MKTIHNLQAIPGDIRPRIAVSEGNPWFLWAETRHDEGEILPLAGPPRELSKRLAIARRDGNLIRRERMFATDGDVIEPCALCVADGAWRAFWIRSQDGTSQLMSCRSNGSGTILREGRIWSADAVALSDGSLLLGAIEFVGREPRLQFYRFASLEDDSPTRLNLEPCEGVWSLSLASAPEGGCWVALDRMGPERFVVEAGFLDVDRLKFTPRPLPGSGFATMPAIASLAGGRAALVWTEDKMWGCGVYDFKRLTRLRYAECDRMECVLVEDVPLPEVLENDDQLSPSAPSLVALSAGVQVYFRRMRMAMRSGDGLVNDWGWPLYRMIRDAEGRWSAPEVFSHDVGYPDDPARVAAPTPTEVAAIYHAGSYDAMRGMIHGQRLHVALVSDVTAPPGPLDPPPPRERSPCPRPRLPDRPVIRSGRASLRCFWGDLHRHSHVSKCIPEHDGGYADHLRFALSARKFDFYSLNDHDTQIGEQEWDRWLACCETVSREGAFACIPGFEGPNHTVQGHINFYFRDLEAARFGYRELRHQESLPRIKDLCRRRGMMGRVTCIRHFHADKLRSEDIFEGEAAFDPELDWCMEAVQGRGFSPVTMHALLAAGFRFGFIGGTDHNRPPGHPRGGIGIYEQAITGIWAPDIGRETLFDALRARRTFCTNGPPMALCLWGNDAIMGTDASCRAENTIQLTVHPTTRLHSIQLVRDGVPIIRREGTAEQAVTETFRDAPGDREAHYYYAVVEQAPEPGLDYPGIGWTSPVWVSFRPS